MKSQRLGRSGLLLLLPLTMAACAGTPEFPTTPPAAAPVAPADFPPFREAVLPSGLRLVVVERPTQPVVSIALALPAGSVHDPEGREGLAGLTATVLTRGAAGRSAEEVSAAIEGVGGMLTAAASEDNLLVMANVLTPDVPLAMELLGEAVTDPHFEPDELELARGQTLQGLRVQLSDPATLAGRIFTSRLYGDHPYGALTTPASLRAIERDDLLAFHRDRIRPDGATLVLAGDITLAEAERLAAEALGDWEGRPAPTAPPAAPPQRAEPEIVLVNRPGSTQASIVAGNLTTTPADDGRYAATVANEILGSVPQGRLFQILRQQHGWTYGASSSFDRPLGIGSFRAVAAVRNEVADSAVTELLAQLRRIGEEPPSSAEIEDARTALVGRFPLQVETAQQVASQVLQAILADLPEDYLRTYRTRLSAVTAEEARSAAADWIRPGQALIVVVGDAAALEEQLRAVAPLTVVDAEGRSAAATARPVEYHLDAGALEPRRDSMTILMQGNPMGWQRSTLERAGDGWRYVEEAQIGAMVQQRTEVMLDRSGMPLSVEQTGSMGGQELDVRLTYADGRVTGRAVVPGQQPRDVGAEVPANVQDDNTLSALIPALQWGPGAVITIPQYSTGTGTVGTLRLEVVGTEEVTVPGGTFEAFRVEMSGGQQPATLFVTTARPHRLVRIAPAGAPIEIVLAN